jgi:hypothetical protein
MAGKSDKTLVQILLQDEELAAIDAYRRTQTNPPSRPQAIRDVLRNALTPRHNVDRNANASAAA